MPDQLEASMLQKVVKMMIDHGDKFEKKLMVLIAWQAN